MDSFSAALQIVGVILFLAFIISIIMAVLAYITKQGEEDKNGNKYYD